MVSAPIRLLVISESPSLAHAVDRFMRRKAVQVKSQWRPANQPSPIDDPENLELIVCPEGLTSTANQVRSEFAPQADIIALPDAVDTDTPELDDDALAERCVEAANAVRERDIVSSLRHQIEVLQSRLQQLQDEAGIAEADIEGGVIMRANKPFIDLIGAESWDDLEATPLLDWVAPDDQAHVKSTLKAAFDQGDLSSSLQFGLAHSPGRSARFCMRLSESDGERMLQIVCKPGHHGTTANAVFVGRRRLEEKLAEWPDHGAGMVHLWIADFHDIEVRAGHAEAALLADELEIALKREAADIGEVFRFGLDEYIVWVNGDEAVVGSTEGALADKISQLKFEAGPLTVELRVSAAHVMLTEEIKTENLLKALRAAYLGRGAGATVAAPPESTPSPEPAPAEPPAEPETAAAADETSEALTGEGSPMQVWRERILDSLKHNRFHIAFQGISPLESGSRAYEALVQLVTADGTQHRLREFHELAEMAGLLGAIDRWVIGQALGRLAEPGTRPSQIFLKLSRNSIDAADQFLQWFTPLIQKTPKLARYLIFEIAESHAVQTPEAVAELFGNLRELGAQTALFKAEGPAASLLPQLGVTWIRLSSHVYGYARTDDALPPNFKDMLSYAREHSTALVAPETKAAATLARLWHWGVKYMRGEPVENEVLTLEEQDRRRRPQLNVVNAK